MLLFKRFFPLRNIAAPSFAFLLIAFGMLFSLHASAQSGSSVAYTSGTYTQNFDGLPTTTPSPDISGSSEFAFGDAPISASSMLGWYGQGGYSDVFLTGSGASSTAGFYSFSNSASPGIEALGLIGNSLTGNQVIGLRLINDSASTIFTSLSVSFLGELWHIGNSNGASASLTFGYQEYTDPQAPIPPGGGINTDTNLHYGDTNTGTSGPVDGALSANQTPLSDVISLSAPWTPGESLWLTWSNLTPVSNSPGLAIDDISFAASGAAAITGTWTGSTNSNWDSSTSNWTNGTYSDGNYVTFGTPPVSGSNVAIAAGGVNPGHVAVTNNTGTYTFSGGSIGGGGFLTKTGSGTLVLSASNSYSGGTVLEGGIVAVNNDDSLGAPGAEVVFGGGELQTNGAGIVSAREFALDSGGGSFNSNGFNSSTSGSLLGSGTFTKIGSGDLTISGPVGATNGQNPILSVLGGTLTLSQGAFQYFTVPITAGAFSGGLVLDGATRAEIAGSANAGVPAWINGGGAISIAGNNAGIDDAAPNIQSAGYLRIDNNFLLNTGSASQPFAASIGTTTGTFGGQLTLDGTISGASAVNFIGPSTDRDVILLNAPSTYTGATNLNDGETDVVRLGVNNALPTTTQLAFGASNGTGGSLDLDGYNQTLAGLTANNGTVGGIVNTGATTSVLTISQSTSSSYYGTIGTPANSHLYGPGTNLNPSGPNLNNISLVKQGTGSLVLGGSNTYSGSTQVNGGTLIVDGEISGSSVVTVGSSGTLAGVGEVYVANGGQIVVNSGGTLSPGDNDSASTYYSPTGSYGVQDSSTTSAAYSANGTLDLKVGGAFAFTLGATSAGGSQAANNINNGLDTQFFVQGSISLAGNLAGTLQSGFTANPGDLFFIIIEQDPNGNEGALAINGAFAGNPGTISLPGPNGTLTFDIGYHGNSTDDTFTGGNDVVLALIPEPGSIACCLSGVSLLLVFSRRRR